MNCRNEKPLVSIITPSYNQGAYLEHTIQSVLRQDYPQVEYILVDGGSTDNSLEIIKHYHNQLAWWVSVPDRGQAEAINKGLGAARGEIVAWLNSDDLYLPGAVSQAVQVLQNEPELGLVYGDALTVDANGHPLNRLSFGDWGLSELLRFRIICQPAVFMRRRVLQEAGSLDESYHFMLDHQLWLRMALRAPIRHMASPWAAARHHPGAKNSAQAAEFSAEIYRLLDWIASEPTLADRWQADRRHITGAAHRLSARYLLDGGAPGPALQTYLKALLAYPSFALQHWHRMAYALLSLAGLGRLNAWYYRMSPPPDLSAYPQLNSWPGLALDR